jgi:hypothetical protein
VQDVGVRIQGLKFMVSSLGFRDFEIEVRAYVFNSGFGLRVWSSGFRVKGLGFRV